MRYAVIIKKHLLEPDHLTPLAARLSSTLHAPAAQIEALLMRGPLTIEADLSSGEARALCARLARQGVQAQIIDELGAELHDAMAPAAQAAQASPQPLATLDAPKPLHQVHPSASKPAVKTVALFDEDELEGALSGLLDDAFSAPAQAPASSPASPASAASSASPASTAAAPASALAPTSPHALMGAWGQVLGLPSSPQLAADTTAAAWPEADVTAVDGVDVARLVWSGADPDQTDPLGSDPFAQARPPQAPAPGPAPAARAQTAGWEALWTTPALEPLPEPAQQKATPTSAPTSGLHLAPAPVLDFGAQPLHEAPAQAAPRADSSWSGGSASGASLSAPGAPASSRQATLPELASRRFDGEALTTAFGGDQDQDQPPYMPKGYDGRPPHSPEIAFALGVIAPGAGHVYNGDDAKALHVGAFFFLIKPWVMSARQARARARRIASYHSPRPQDGSLARAIRYAALWYGVVALIVSFFGWSASVIYARLNPVEPPPAPVDLALVARAVGYALVARSQAVHDADRARHEAQVQWRQAQMSDEERAERLFLVSLPECQMNNIDVCVESMKRVTQLNPRHPYAFKLQVWASMRQRTSELVPMPEIPGYQSILDYEDARAKMSDGELDRGSQPQPQLAD